MSKLVAIATLSAAGILTCLAAGTAAASTTDAAPGYVKGVGYATSYTSPSTASVPVHHLAPGTEVTTYCFREGQVVNGNDYWFVISKAGETAYLHRDSIVPPHDVRHC